MIIYVEPVRSLAPDIAKQLAQLTGETGRVVLKADAGVSFWERWLNRPHSQPGLDPRVQAALLGLEAMLEGGRVALDDVAREAGLSPERFRHVFADQMGVPFRRFVLWRRLRLAASAMLAGEGATVAAHSAGFADAAHLSRTFKSMFGVTAGDTLLPLPSNSRVPSAT